MKQKTIFFIFGFIAGAILGGAAMSIVWQAKSNQADQTQAEKINTTGKVICLPHKEASGPQTLECAVGMQADDGKVYSLQTPLQDTALASAAGSDKKIRATGTLKPTSDSIYKIDGTLSVESYEFN